MLYDLFGSVDNTEILRLRQMLEEADIPHFIHQLWGGKQICYPSRENLICSVVQHGGSYGGRDGKLEIMGLLTDEEEERDSVVGWLTAEEVFARIQKDFQKNT